MYAVPHRPCRLGKNLTPVSRFCRDPATIQTRKDARKLLVGSTVGLFIFLRVFWKPFGERTCILLLCAMRYAHRMIMIYVGVIPATTLLILLCSAIQCRVSWERNILNRSGWSRGQSTCAYVTSHPQGLARRIPVERSSNLDWLGWMKELGTKASRVNRWPPLSLWYGGRSCTLLGNEHKVYEDGVFQDMGFILFSFQY